MIPYTLAVVFIGIPLFYFEGAVGQMFQRTLPFSFGMINKGLKMFGLAFLLVLCNGIGFYNILLTYLYRFLFTAFNSKLPFA